MTNDTPSAPHSPTSLALVALLVAVAAGAGFAIGRQSREPAPVPAAPSVTENSEVRDARPGEVIDALRVRDPFERARWLGSELPKLGSGAVVEVRYALQAAEIDRGPVEYELLVRRWAQEDPALAFHWASTQSPKRYREGLIRAAAREWGFGDPQAATQKISSQSGDRVGNPAIQGLISGWADSGEPGLEQYIYDMGYSFERQFTVAVWMRTIGLREGPQAIADVAESVSTEDERFKSTVMRKAAAQMTTFDPAYGVDWEEKHGSGPYGDSILNVVSSRWVQTDGPAAIEWISRAEPGKRRDIALGDAFRLWAQNDRAGMLAWVEEMGMDGIEPWFEPAIGNYVMARSIDDPEKALVWTDLMPDPKQQRSARLAIVRRWRTAEPDAADAWIESSAFTEEERRIARTPLPKIKPDRPYFEKLPPRSDATDDEAGSVDSTETSRDAPSAGEAPAG